MIHATIRKFMLYSHATLLISTKYLQSEFSSRPLKYSAHVCYQWYGLILFYFCQEYSISPILQEAQHCTKSYYQKKIYIQAEYANSGDSEKLISLNSNIVQ
jgi:hypothetical protein